MKNLAALAANPSRSRGRAHCEADSGPRGPRDIFQRDRDRIIHSVAFRRLRSKTQVFVAPDGDHFRVRLTHSLEVSSVGRSLGKKAGEVILERHRDLSDVFSLFDFGAVVAAAALAHDLGNPPFDKAVDRVMLCGGPSVLVDLKKQLLDRGYEEGSIASPGDFVLERAFVET